MELNKKKVYCITTGEYFLSITEARKKYPNAVKIGQCCKGKRKTSGTNNNGERLKWRYWTDKEIERYKRINIPA